MRKTIASLCVCTAVCALAFSVTGCSVKTEKQVLSSVESGSETALESDLSPDTKNASGRMLKVYYDGILLDLSTTKNKSFLDIVQEFQLAGLTACSISGTTTNDVSDMELTIAQIAASIEDINENEAIKIEFREGEEEPFSYLLYSEAVDGLVVSLTENNDKLRFTEDQLTFTDIKDMDGKKLISEKLFDTISEDGTRLEAVGPNPQQTISHLSGQYFLNYNLSVTGFGSLGEDGEGESAAAITTGEGAKLLVDKLGILSNGTTELNLSQWIDDDGLDNALNILEPVEGTAKNYWSISWSAGDAEGSVSEPATAEEIREQYGMFRKASTEQGGYGYFSFGFYFYAPGQEALVFSIETKDDAVTKKKVHMMCGGDSDNLVGTEKITLPGKDLEFIKENVLKGLNQKEEDEYYLSDGTYKISIELDRQAVEDIQLEKTVK